MSLEQNGLSLNQTENPTPLFKKIENAVEQKELDKDAFLPWLAAGFELNGGMGFSVRKRRERHGQIQVMPYINRLDTEEHTCWMAELYGGKANFHKKGVKHPIWRWQVYGRKAVEIASMMKPFSPSWLETIMAFKKWEATGGNIDDQIEIAKKWKKNNGRAAVGTDVYIKLIMNPSFLAGIIDARAYGTKSHIVQGDVQQTLLEFTTVNKSLLMAMKSVYSGKVKLATEAGTQKRIRGHEFETHRNSYDYKLGLKNSKKVIQAANPFIQFKKQLGGIMISQ